MIINTSCQRRRLPETPPWKIHPTSTSSVLEQNPAGRTIGFRVLGMNGPFLELI